MYPAVKEWREELLKEGIEQGEGKFGSLVVALIADNAGRETIARVAADPGFRKTMYEMYNIH